MENDTNFLTVHGQDSIDKLGLKEAKPGDIYGLEVIEVGEDVKLNFIKLPPI